MDNSGGGARTTHPFAPPVCCGRAVSKLQAVRDMRCRNALVQHALCVLLSALFGAVDRPAPPPYFSAEITSSVDRTRPILGKIVVTANRCASAAIEDMASSANTCS